MMMVAEDTLEFGYLLILKVKVGVSKLKPFWVFIRKSIAFCGDYLKIDRLPRFGGGRRKDEKRSREMAEAENVSAAF